MLKNAYLIAKIGADTAENEQNFAEILIKSGNWLCTWRGDQHALQPLADCAHHLRGLGLRRSAECIFRCLTGSALKPVVLALCEETSFCARFQDFFFQMRFQLLHHSSEESVLSRWDLHRILCLVHRFFSEEKIGIGEIPDNCRRSVCFPEILRNFEKN